MKQREATKAIIQRDDCVLLIKREANNPVRPNTWDLPGGRVEIGETILAGLYREVREEVGLTVDSATPLGQHQFIRDDGQAITMHVYSCDVSGEATTSEEASKIAWVSLTEAKQRLHKNLTTYITQHRK